MIRLTDQEYREVTIKISKLFPDKNIKYLTQVNR